MDSMDWFNPEEDAAAKQARALNRALKVDGRVLLRSASIEPWYVKDFEQNGFSVRRVGARFPGLCIDRYALFISPLLPQSNPLTPMQGEYVCIHLALYEDEGIGRFEAGHLIFGTGYRSFPLWTVEQCRPSGYQ
jgi:uncharacterized protein DUF3419